MPLRCVGSFGHIDIIVNFSENGDNGLCLLGVVCCLHFLALRAGVSDCGVIDPVSVEGKISRTVPSRSVSVNEIHHTIFIDGSGDLLENGSLLNQVARVEGGKVILVGKNLPSFGELELVGQITVNFL